MLCPICQNWRIFQPKHHRPFKRSADIEFFYSVPCSHNMFLWSYISRFAWTFFLAQVIVRMSCELSLMIFEKYVCAGFASNYGILMI